MGSFRTRLLDSRLSGFWLLLAIAACFCIAHVNATTPEISKRQERTLLSRLEATFYSAKSETNQSANFQSLRH